MAWTYPKRWTKNEGDKKYKSGVRMPGLQAADLLPCCWGWRMPPVQGDSWIERRIWMSTTTLMPSSVPPGAVDTESNGPKKVWHHLSYSYNLIQLQKQAFLSRTNAYFHSPRQCRQPNVAFLEIHGFRATYERRTNEFCLASSMWMRLYPLAMPLTRHNKKPYTTSFRREL